MKTQANSIQDLLVDIKFTVRPLTTKEIELIITGKNRRNMYRELKSLIKRGIIKKVKFEAEGYTINKKYILNKQGHLIKKESVIVY